MRKRRRVISLHLDLMIVMRAAVMTLRVMLKSKRVVWKSPSIRIFLWISKWRVITLFKRYSVKQLRDKIYWIKNAKKMNK